MLRNLYRNMGIQRKLFAFFLIVALIPIYTLGTLSYVKSSDIINTQFGNYGDYAVKQLKQSLDSNLQNMEFISSDVISYLFNPMHQWFAEPLTYETVVEQRNLQSFLQSHASVDLLGLFVITKRGDVFGTSSSTIDSQKLMNAEWWKSIPPDAQGRYWIGFHDTDYYNLATYHHVVGLVVPLLTTRTIPQGTRILVEMKADSFMNLIRSFEKDTDSFVTISDRNGTVLYQTDTADFKAKDDDVEWNDALETNGWSINVKIPYQTFYKSSKVIQTNTLLIGLLSLIVALFLASWFASTITRPMKRLVQSMNLVSDGNLGTRVRVDANDELGRLSQRFNYMTSRIQALITENALLAVKRKEAELKMLHYQINPHLMFNTLNSIQWKAKLAGMKEVPQMIFHLTRVLESSLRPAAELVILKEELDTIDHFLKIQEYRFGSVFRYVYEGEDELEQCLIPRMTLQPLFENIFYHAFSDGAGEIRLRAHAHQDTAVLELTDDGVGIRREHLPELIKPNPPGKGRGGLGLYNVQEKFHLQYGPEYGLKIESEPNVGTKVTIRWPIVKEG